MPPQQSQYTVQARFGHDGQAVVTLAGHLDRVAAPRLAELYRQIAARQPSALVYDMSEVTYMDDAAVQQLIAVCEHLPAGEQPVLRHPGPIVLRLLEVTGLGRLCVIDP